VITELRRYRLRPEKIDSWLAFFEEAAAENARHGIRVEYAGLNRETGEFVWLRSFADEPDRVQRKAAFYGGQWWLERETYAMDHVLEYGVEFLEAAIVRQGGDVIAQRRVASDEAVAGSTVDSPPDGFVRSTAARWVRGAGSDPTG